MRVRIAFLIVTCFLVANPMVRAWNKPGHMTSAAIAYADLKDRNPAVLVKVIEVLKQHPHFESQWANKLNQVSVGDRDSYLFMLAARWPDDARGDSNYDHPTWHYVDIPYHPGHANAEIPQVESIITAFPENRSIVGSSASNNRARAVALCWVLHLSGDVHQPLHTISLMTDQFPGPEGDKGGNKFFIRVTPTSSGIELHSFWDGLILGSDKFKAVSDEATELRNRPGFKREGFAEQLAVKPFNDWAKETYAIAVKDAYLNGKLEGSSDKHDGAVLPDDYAKRAKGVAERQIVLAGYRISDAMVEVFGQQDFSGE